MAAPMLWFAFDPEQGRLVHGEESSGEEGAGAQEAGDAEALRAALRHKNLEPVLVISRSRWEADLSGGPEGLPARPRTAAELAAVRAQDPELEHRKALRRRR